MDKTKVARFLWPTVYNVSTNHLQRSSGFGQESLALAWVAPAGI